MFLYTKDYFVKQISNLSKGVVIVASAKCQLTFSLELMGVKIHRYLCKFKVFSKLINMVLTPLFLLLHMTQVMAHKSCGGIQRNKPHSYFVVKPQTYYHLQCVIFSSVLPISSDLSR